MMTDVTSPHILIVLTNHEALGETGKKTGFYLSEVSHPYTVFAEAGVKIDFVSPKGGATPMDGVDRSDAENVAFLEDHALVDRTQNSLASADVDPTKYQAIFFAGGHGTMWDFADDPGLQRLAREVYEAGGVVGAVCHGPSGLTNVQLSDGSFLVAGKRVAAFTNDEEAAVGLTDVVPFALESRMRERGAEPVVGANFQANVVVDERLVTGQNPASARGVAEAIVELLPDTSPTTK